METVGCGRCLYDQYLLPPLKIDDKKRCGCYGKKPRSSRTVKAVDYWLTETHTSSVTTRGVLSNDHLQAVARHSASKRNPLPYYPLPHSSAVMRHPAHMLEWLSRARCLGT